MSKRMTVSRPVLALAVLYPFRSASLKEIVVQPMFFFCDGKDRL
jgi:hypothetical protein